MADDVIDIPAASMNTVRNSLRHGMVEITDDVQNIARDLAEIDPALRLFRDEEADIWVVWLSREEPDGSVSENLVTTMKGTLDKRIVHRARRVAADDYNLADEIEAREAQSDRDQDHARRESIGPVAERLLHAMQKDTGIKTRVFVP